MATPNPLWGAPRIHGELLKLGIEVSERTLPNRQPSARSLSFPKSADSTTATSGAPPDPAAIPAAIATSSPAPAPAGDRVLAKDW
ncbi:MAG: hypothetical protein O6951_03600, partial [Actinobacteria bacterium]|nr:hypothetical protein [Actinomycetota bacterium]